MKKLPTLVLLLIYIQISTQLNTLYKASITNFQIENLAKRLGGEAGEDLEWFAKTAELFTFKGHDGLPLQGYYIPPKKNINTSKVIIHCAGWSETTCKYANFLKILYEAGYPIYSFDMRGQGFSSATGDDKGVVTHVDNFSEYVDDLQCFITKEVKMKVESEKINNENENEKKNEVEYVYLANSMAALVGLTLQARTVGRAPAPFARMALVTPCIKPLGFNILTNNVLRVANKVGLNRSLLVRLPRDISTLKNTHNKEKAKAWCDLRELASDRLVVQGPSVRFMCELVRASGQIRKSAERIRTPMLVLQAGDEIFVENEAMSKFFTKIRSPSAKLVRFSTSYHEILIESNDIFEPAIKEILNFLK